MTQYQHCKKQITGEEASACEHAADMNGCCNDAETTACPCPTRPLAHVPGESVQVVGGSQGQQRRQAQQRHKLEPVLTNDAVNSLELGVLVCNRPHLCRSGVQGTGCNRYTYMVLLLHIKSEVC
jgi:hypothetical protein